MAFPKRLTISISFNVEAPTQQCYDDILRVCDDKEFLHEAAAAAKEVFRDWLNVPSVITPLEHRDATLPVP